mgnify:CR=1 FL=1|jgi:hypothetical protein
MRTMLSTNATIALNPLCNIAHYGTVVHNYLLLFLLQLKIFLPKQSKKIATLMKFNRRLSATN